MFYSKLLACLQSLLREGKLAERTRSGRYVGHTDSSSTCIILNEKTNRLFKQGRGKKFDCSEAKRQMNKVTEIPLEDDFDNFVNKPDAFLDSGCRGTTTRGSKLMLRGTTMNTMK